MKKLYTLAVASLMASTAWGALVTDVISPETITLTNAYVEQEATFNSTATYLVTLKDEGDGPQFKAGGSSIVVKTTAGTVTKIEVTWGAKSNESVQVFGSDTPYSASKAAITGTELGVVAFEANGTTSLTIDGSWKYIGLTSTAEKGKACQFKSLAITWDSDTEVVTDPSQGLVINEVCGDDGTTDGNEDWVEIMNPTDAALPLAGVCLTKLDEDGVATEMYTFASDEPALQPGEYFVVTKGTHFASGLSNNKNLTIVMAGATGLTLDRFNKAYELTDNGNHYAGGSYSRIPDGTGKWLSVANATAGAANDPTQVEPKYVTYKAVTNAQQIYDGMEFVLACTADITGGDNYVMAASWGKTKDGGVYQLSTPGTAEDSNMTFDANKAAICILTGNSQGETWAIKFGATNNYLNDSRYLACAEYKNMDFKKNDDPAKGTRATLTFNENGTVEISYGELTGGSVKFNPKDDGTSRFMNYDPADKPDEHLAIRMYAANPKDVAAVADIHTETGAATYYNLQGMRVVNPQPGQVLIRVYGNKATKVY